MCNFANSNLLHRGTELMLCKYHSLWKSHELPLCVHLHSSFGILIVEQQKKDEIKAKGRSQRRQRDISRVKLVETNYMVSRYRQ